MKRSTTSTKSKTVYQFKITLQDSKPPIWRRVLVSPDMTLHAFHDVIQIAFGWSDTHLHVFNYGGRGGRSFSLPIEDAEEEDDGFFLFESQDEDSRSVTLESLHLNILKKPFQYWYDFGDDWIHNIVFEKELDASSLRVPVPICIKAAGNGPVEDSGGMWGYYEKLEILKDPTHLNHAYVKKWMPSNFDPAFVDIDGINEAMREAF